MQSSKHKKAQSDDSNIGGRRQGYTEKEEEKGKLKAAHFVRLCTSLMQ